MHVLTGFRPSTSDFITQQLQLMTAMQAEQEQRVKELEQRKLARPSSNRRREPGIPPVPSIPQGP
jgi:Arc/MetJ-type ribon-helix-helix transcriptional regulator